MNPPFLRRGVPGLMFLFSGAAALIYETALQRELHRTFGASAFATATVLAAFMGGTALGAWGFGRVVDRAMNPLRFYAWLELGVAACAVLTPAGALALNRLFLLLARGSEVDAPRVVALRMILAFAFMLPPTVLMGGTLPALSRSLRAEDAHAGAGPWISRLYMFNLAGAAGGAFVAAYVALPHLGLSRTLWLGALLNMAAGGLALALALDFHPLPPTPVGGSAARPARRVLLVAAAWSGFASLAYEVVWTQLLALVVGNSVYAFGIMLGVFLLGLLVGARWVASLDSGEVSWKLLGWVQLLSAGLVLLTLVVWERIPGAFVLLGHSFTGFWGRELIRGVACLFVIGVPAAGLGGFYPLLLRQAGEDARGLGQAVGGISAWNTLGAVAGSLGAGFVLLPVLGSRGLIELLVVLSALVAVLCFKGLPTLQLLSLGVAACVLIVPPWNLAKLATGENVYFTVPYWARGRLVFKAESVESGFTTVSEYPPGSKQYILLSNGKFQGNDTGEATAQYRFAQLPMLVHHGYDHALMVGVGTGSSLAVLAAQPYRSVDAVEMSRDIVRAARTFFTKGNAGVLDSPRVKLHFGDGRNYLLLSDQRFDLITIELTSIWIAGEADLYNREFYALARSHLAPGGVIQQWVQLHHMSRRDLASVLQSVKAELPHVALFVGGGQGQILASQEPLTVDYEAVEALSQQLRAKLATRTLPGGDILTLYGELALDERAVDRFLEDEAQAEGMSVGALTSTDDNLLLEYETPQGNAMRGDTLSERRADLARFGPVSLAEVPGARGGVEDHLAAARLVGAHELKGVPALLDRATSAGALAAPLQQWVQAYLAKQRLDAETGHAR